MILSKRLKTIADMVTKGNVIADIGTDHGYIPIYLVNNGVCPIAYAMDINAGPLKRAEEHINENKLSDKIFTIQSNGMEKLESGMADTVIIAGMGGELIHSILKEATVLNSLKELILSPHLEIDKVRRFILENGWTITQEKMLVDNNKYYTVMKAVFEQEIKLYNEPEMLYGRVLLNERNTVLLSYIENQYDKYERILEGLKKNNKGSEREKEIEKLIKINRMAREVYD